MTFNQVSHKPILFVIFLVLVELNKVFFSPNQLLLKCLTLVEEDKMSEFHTLDAHDISGAYQKGTLSPVEVTRETLDRIDAVNPVLNVFTKIDHDGAMADARASEIRWANGSQLSAWDGVPATIKDLIETKDWSPNFGSKVISSSLKNTDGPATARLREAGCVLLGMTTSPELGWKGITDSPRFGITRNAWDASKTPGGSSGGAAVAAALSLGYFHVGTDGGGSIRMPAAFSGIFGIKATFGRVPAFPASIMGTLAHVGPMTRTVRDGTAMLNLLTRPDPRDWYASPSSDEISLPKSSRLDDLKIAYSPDLGYMDVDPEVAAAVNNAVQTLEGLGAVTEQIAPVFDKPQHIFETLWLSAARNRLSKLPLADRALVDPGLLDATESVAHLEITDYIEAELQRARLGLQIENLLGDYDVLVTPTVPIPAFEAGLETPSDQGRWTDWAGFNYPFNLGQQPACSVPCGFTASGLPIGLQIIARKYRDDVTLRVAAAYQAAHPVPWPTDKGVLATTASRPAY
jgi:aspartyl-tRNA(Asn)/glutamyl-tRNA(Gln) amidotransferase subunit A